MVLDTNAVKGYVELYITLDDEIFNNIYNDTLGEYNYLKRKYGFSIDDNYLMALLMLNRIRDVLKVRNSKMQMKLIDSFNDEIKRILRQYTNPFSSVIPNADN